MAHQTFFKEPKSPAVTRAQKRLTVKAKEDRAKTKVRQRDHFCRFPFCGCRKLGLRAEVSHRRHKGMGGNPAGDRSSTADLLLLCSARHKDNRLAVDRRTIRWEPLTERGADGPIEWFIDLRELPTHQSAMDQAWMRLAVETRPGVYERMSALQRSVLTFLATMDC
jgi:hypothetical protein